MLFKNETNEAKSVRRKDEKGNYFWKWVEPNNTIELDEVVGVQNGLSKCKDVTKEVKGKVSNTQVETKRLETKEKKPKYLETKKVKK